jgi:ABC-type sugar transport system permease subunit
VSRGPRATDGLAVASRTPPGPGADERPVAAGSRRREPAVWLAAPGALFFLLIVGIPLVIVIWTSFLRIGSGNIASWATAPCAGVSNYSTGLTGPNVLGVPVLESVE